MKPIIKYYCISDPKYLKEYNIYASIFIGHLKIFETESDFPTQIFMEKTEPFALIRKNGFNFDALLNSSSDEGPAIICYDPKGNVVLEHYIFDNNYIGRDLNFSESDIKNYLLLR